MKRDKEHVLKKVLEFEKLKHVSLSNNTVSQRITEMPDNILSQVISKIKTSMFNYVTIQIDETTDMVDVAQICVYKVDQFFNTHGINWEYVASMCTDSAPAMLGCCSGFQTMVKEKCPNAIGMHCILHHQALMVKTMPNHLKNVLNDVVKAVNFIKANALNSRLFDDLCKDNVQGQFLNAFTVLTCKVVIQGESTEKSPHFMKGDTQFLICLAFLVNIFESVNSVNLALQRKDITFVHYHEKNDCISNEAPFVGIRLRHSRTVHQLATLLAIKTKACNKLNVAHDMRVALSKMQPNIEDILQTKQIPSSH
uniref:DUF4371 domain-containing protein n=1 Tax=Octopus bimaculoides TaxID=37653 RepID=A0A0L8GBM5_OCTBM